MCFSFEPSTSPLKMSVWSVIAVIFSFIWSLLQIWLYSFYVSFTNSETIWIIIPIWLSWFFTEFFQEKKGTSFGDALSNGVVPFWVGIDWMRQLTLQLTSDEIIFSSLVFVKYLISVLILIYGFIIIAFGIKGKDFIKYFGRIREVTYILAVLTPFVYGLITPSYRYFLSVIIFFPVFYFIVEFIDRLTPEPTIYKKEKTL